MAGEWRGRVGLDVNSHSVIPAVVVLCVDGEEINDESQAYANAIFRFRKTIRGEVKEEGGLVHDFVAPNSVVRSSSASLGTNSEVKFGQGYSHATVVCGLFPGCSRS